MIATSTEARHGPLVGSSAGSLAAAYGRVRALTEELARPLSAEDQTVQSMPDASPTKWHRAHTSWFFETFLLQPHLAGYGAFDPAYSYLFNSYYEAVGARHPRAQRGLVTRPGIEGVRRYRAHVDRAMLELLDRLDGPGGPALADLAELGLHHECQHQELLLMDIKHALSASPCLPAYRDLPEPDRPEPGRRPGWIEHPGGLTEIGHAGPAAGFAFDNEGPRHPVYLQPFALAGGLVTNADWLAFVADGGYRRPELWLSEGWATVQAQGWEAPLYWSLPARVPGSRPDPASPEDGQVFTLGGPRRLEPAEPVGHVSYYEADAFATWAGARLPTEAEWEAVAVQRRLDGNFLDLDVLHPRPHSQEPPGLAGDVWQWTSSAYGPYPGYRPAPGAVGEYNGKFMVSQYVLRGGSCVTPPGHVRASYRNFFPPSARWAFSGLRLAADR